MHFKKNTINSLLWWGFFWFVSLFVWFFSHVWNFSFTPGRLADWYLPWLTDSPLSSHRHAHISRNEKVTYLPFIHLYKPNGWLSNSRLEFSNETLHNPHLSCPKSPEGYRHGLIIELLVYFQHLFWCWAGELEPEAKNKTLIWPLGLCFVLLPGLTMNDAPCHKKELQMKLL